MVTSIQKCVAKLLFKKYASGPGHGENFFRLFPKQQAISYEKLLPLNRVQCMLNIKR